MPLPLHTLNIIGTCTRTSSKKKIGSDFDQIDEQKKACSLFFLEGGYTSTTIHDTVQHIYIRTYTYKSTESNNIDNYF